MLLRNGLVFAFLMGLAASSCSNGSSDDSSNGNHGGAGGQTHSDASASDATDGALNGECGIDADCTSKLPVTAPVDCAEAKCDLLQRKCEFLAKDADGDGHRAKACSGGLVPIQTGDDCDDGNDQIYPGAWDGPSSAVDGGTSPTPNHCDNIDQNCDGTPDNDRISGPSGFQTCRCDPAHPSPCYEYPSGLPINVTTLGKGVCKQGTQTCNDGVPGACVGAVGPSSEICNGLDDDCDGIKDNNVPGAPVVCADADKDSYCTSKCMTACTPPSGYRAQATCLPGVDCNDANKNVHPGATELCGDGIDSNCSGGDSETFSNLGQSCWVGTNGVCRRQGVFQCTAAKTGTECSVVAGAPANSPGTPSTDPTIDQTQAHYGYNPNWDWNCNGQVDTEVIRQGSFRAAACGGDYESACNVLTNSECTQLFLGNNYFSCETSGGFYLTPYELCGHPLNLVNCWWNYPTADDKCHYIDGTLQPNNTTNACY